MKVRELKGYKSLKALNAFHALMLGLKMLPEYQAVSYEDFFELVERLPPDGQEAMIRRAAQFVELKQDEVEAIVCFVEDNNGVPYDATNLKNLNPLELVEIIVAVCKAIAAIRIGLVTEDEKKN